MHQRDTIFWWKTVSAPRSVDSRSYRVQLGRSGDQICLFGFSRGAFTARALAGMVQKVGILPPRNIEQLQFAFAVYEREDDVGLEQSLQFKRSFSVEVRITLAMVCHSIYRPTTDLISVQGYRGIRWAV